MSPDNIILIALISLLFVVYIYALVRITTKWGFPPKLRGQIIVIAIGILFGSLVTAYLFYNLFCKPYGINPADWVEISLLVGLVGVTSVYALSALRQADASVKMAKEMKEQRYDTVRPVIDIQRNVDANTRIREALAAESEEASYGLHCIFRNVGVGPALNVFSFIQIPGGERRRWEFGTLPAGEATKVESLSFSQWELVAYYRDVYGRVFKSSREVSIDNLDNTKWNVGPLRVCLINEGELP